METPSCAITELHFGKFPEQDVFQSVSFKTEVCVSTSTPELTMSWIHEVEMARSSDDLKTSQSIGGESFLDFEMLDARIASALRKIISLWPLSINQSLWYSSEPVGSVQYLFTGWWRPRFRYKMGSDLFGNEWDASGKCSRRFVQKQITRSEQLQTVFAMYNKELSGDRVAPNYQKLRSMVRQHID